MQRTTVVVRLQVHVTGLLLLQQLLLLVVVVRVLPCDGFTNSVVGQFESSRRRIHGVVSEIQNRPSSSTTSSPQSARRRRRIGNMNYDDDYWEEDEDDFDLEDDRDRRPYQVSLDNDNELLTDYDKDPQLHWEKCGDDEDDEDGCWVLLPPLYVTKPTAVIHFCGGTFFGSAPKLWYGPLLEGLCRATQCVIVATAIPITWTENPLQHVLLSRKLQRQFQTAYVTVLEDEYGDTALSDVPVVALGHSLGSRLLAVLATLAPPRNAAAPPYKSFILMSFTNYGASAGIPGVQQLMKSRNNLDAPKARSRRRNRSRSRYDEEDYDDELDDDDDLEELIEELQQNVLEQTTKIRDALTPLSQDLEFYPTPDQLWDALAKDKRFTVPETLIVQFDDDEVDQSARLASILKDTSNVKYARLQGNHLSPVAVEAKAGSWLDLPSKATKALVKVIRGKPVREKSTDTSTMRDLRQTIARYITDVVTK